VGLSSIDSQDAANNETTRFMDFQTGRWYLSELRVTDARIQAWIDADKVVDLTTTDRTISIRLEVEESKPMGIAPRGPPRRRCASCNCAGSSRR